MFLQANYRILCALIWYKAPYSSNHPGPFCFFAMLVLRTIVLLAISVWVFFFLLHRLYSESFFFTDRQDWRNSSRFVMRLLQTYRYFLSLQYQDFALQQQGFWSYENFMTLSSTYSGSVLRCLLQDCFVCSYFLSMGSEYVTTMEFNRTYSYCFLYSFQHSSPRHQTSSKTFEVYWL